MTIFEWIIGLIFSSLVGLYIEHRAIENGWIETDSFSGAEQLRGFFASAYDHLRCFVLQRAHIKFKRKPQIDTFMSDMQKRAHYAIFELHKNEIYLSIEDYVRLLSRPDSWDVWHPHTGDDLNCKGHIYGCAIYLKNTDQ